MPRGTVCDRWLFFTTGLLVLAGLIMVASTSHYSAMRLGLSPYHYLVKHLLYLGLGTVLLVATMHLPYQKLNDPRVVYSLMGATLLALTVVLAMPAAKGAHRWFSLGLFSVQPSELAKVAVILFMAYFLSQRQERVNDSWGVLFPCLAVTGLAAALVVVEPDLGSAVMLCATTCVMLFVAGLRWKYIGAVAGLGAIAVAALVVFEPYRIRRLLAYLNPTEDLLGANFQPWQSIIAVGSGGLAGVGLGQGQQKAYFLPDAHTDFIFSVVGEELGLIGTALLLTAFVLLFWRGLRAAVRAPDSFGFYLALGTTSLLVMQALVHMGVCLCLLPPKGLPLPFVSYGGSSLLVGMAAMGLLLNVSQHSN